MTPEEQYKICGQYFKSIIKTQEHTLAKLEEIDRRLFRGNGVPPFDVRLDRAERVITRICWAGAVVATPMLAKIGYELVTHLV